MVSLSSNTLDAMRKGRPFPYGWTDAGTNGTSVVEFILSLLRVKGGMMMRAKGGMVLMYENRLVAQTYVVKTPPLSLANVKSRPFSPRYSNANTDSWPVLSRPMISSSGSEAATVQFAPIGGSLSRELRG